MDVTRSFTEGGASRIAMTAATGTAATSQRRQNHNKYNSPAGTPSRKMLRVNPSTSETLRIAAQNHPAIFHLRSGEKKRYAARSSSTIISSPPNVIQWLM